MVIAPTPAGPLQHATLIIDDADAVIRAYRALGFSAQDAAEVGAARATAWGCPQVAPARQTWLTAPGNSTPLLRVLQLPGAAPRPTRFSHGWLALEILVRDVDALAPRFAGAGFEIVGPPADLEVSPHIRAMQVVGPAGEMLYLTQVKAPVPPFQIPLSSALDPAVEIGPLFIAVMSTPSREATLASLAPLAPLATLSFETRITVLNRALGEDTGRRWPVATAQWAGDCLFEIDEVRHARLGPVAAAAAGLPSGLAWVTMVMPDARDPTIKEVSVRAWIEPAPPGHHQAGSLGHCSKSSRAPST